eukprot:SAG31_NODE_2238_length_6119_cov_3.847508_2_plen_75_part_00
MLVARCFCALPIEELAYCTPQSAVVNSGRSQNDENAITALQMLIYSLLKKVVVVVVAFVCLLLLLMPAKWTTSA